MDNLIFTNLETSLEEAIAISGAREFIASPQEIKEAINQYHKIKKPLVINLFGAPGAGKSTGAAIVFAELKKRGVNAELVTEFTKDKT